MPVTYFGLYVQMCCGDRHRIPDHEHGGHRQYRERRPAGLAVHAVAEDLQRRGDQQAGAEHDQILPAVHVSSYLPCVDRARQARISPRPATCSRLPVPTEAR